MESGRLAATTLEPGRITKVYTVPTSAEVINYTMTSISVCNRGTQPTAVKIGMLDAGDEQPANADWLEYNTEILGHGVLERTGMLLGPGQSFVVASSSEHVSIMVFGIFTGKEDDNDEPAYTPLVSEFPAPLPEAGAATVQFVVDADPALVPDGTTVRFRFSGDGVTRDDFQLGSDFNTLGYSDVTINSGQGVLTFRLREDSLTEGRERVRVTADPNDSAGNYTGRLTSLVIVEDASTTSGTPATVYEYTVTSSGASAYSFSGDITGDNPSITAVVGDTIVFDVNASGHPFYVKTQATLGAVDQVDYVINNGAEVGEIEWTIDQPGTYYYQCAVHAAMGGTITVTAT